MPRTLLSGSVSVLAGMLAAASLPPVDRSLLVFVGMTLGVVLLRRTSSRREALLLDWLLGLGYFGSVLAWSGRFGSLAWVLLAASQAVFWLPLGWALHRTRGLRPARVVVVVASTALLAEAARSRVPLGGLEWAQLGVTVHGSALRPAAAIIGSLGLTFVVVAIAVALALVTEPELGHSRWRTLAGTAGIVTGLVLLGSIPFTAATGNVKVAIVQTAPTCPGQAAVDCPGRRASLRAELSSAMRRLQAYSGIDLAIWGEGVVSARDLDAVNAQVGAIAVQPSPPVLLGVTSPAGPGRFWNRNVLVSGSGDVRGAYAKRQPVPFGEYIPGRALLGNVQQVGRLVPSDLRRETSTRPLLLDDVGLGTVSSWEVTFGRLVRDVAPQSAALVTLTSQATYERAPVSDQLIRAAQLRAAEHQRSVIVAATTGRSVVVSPDGSRGETTRLFGADLLVQDVELREGTTPYTRFGEVFVVALALLLLASAMFWRNRTAVPLTTARPTIVP